MATNVWVFRCTVRRACVYEPGTVNLNECGLSRPPTRHATKWCLINCVWYVRKRSRSRRPKVLDPSGILVHILSFQRTGERIGEAQQQAHPTKCAHVCAPRLEEAPRVAQKKKLSILFARRTFDMDCLTPRFSLLLSFWN